MEISRGISSCFTSPSRLRFVVILLILLFSPSASQAGDSKSNEKEEKLTLNAVERGIGVPVFNSHWEAFSSWAKLAWMNLRQPESSGCRKPGTAEKMKEASKKSFKTSKDTMEKSAAAAAKAAEKAVGMTREKIKKAVSKARVQDAEL